MAISCKGQVSVCRGELENKFGVTTCAAEMSVWPRCAAEMSVWPRSDVRPGQFNENGNDFVFYSAVEKDALIAVLWHISCFANRFSISIII